MYLESTRIGVANAQDNDRGALHSRTLLSGIIFLLIFILFFFFFFFFFYLIFLKRASGTGKS